MKSVKGRKEGKDEEIKGEAIRPFEEVKRRSEVPRGEDVKSQRKEKSQQVRLRTGAVLKNCVSESKQKRRKIERVRENT